MSKENSSKPNKTVLVIDDEKMICNLLSDVLSDEGFEVATEYTAEKGLKAIKSKMFDLIFLDLRLPDADGIELLQKIKEIVAQPTVIIITGYPSFKTAQMALKIGGVHDYITKPFKLEDIIVSLNRALSYQQLTKEKEQLLRTLAEKNKLLEEQSNILEHKVKERTYALNDLYNKLQETYLNTLKTLAEAIDARDHYTATHSKNVTRVALLIARKMGLSQEERRIIEQACELHDIGKIGIPDNILNKPEELLAGEKEAIQIHPAKGAEILSPLTFLKTVAKIVRQHHERWDGSGYPDGLKAEAIQMGARIIAVADTYDAMISARIYREQPCTKEEAIMEIKKNNGIQFDPKIVKIFLEVVNEI